MTATLTTHTFSGPTEKSLHALDTIGFIVGSIITLGPLAATALFGH